ncbi:MAG: hypothetical protein ABIA04_15660 [Pseudomonadota bacterium]
MTRNRLSMLCMFILTSSIFLSGIFAEEILVESDFSYEIYTGNYDCTDKGLYGMHIETFAGRNQHSKFFRLTSNAYDDVNDVHVGPGTYYKCFFNTCRLDKKYYNTDTCDSLTIELLINGNFILKNPCREREYLYLKINKDDQCKEDKY